MHCFEKGLRDWLPQSVGLWAVFVFHLLCFHEGRDLWHFPVPVPMICTGAILGFVASCLLQPLGRCRPGAYKVLLTLGPLVGACLWFWALASQNFSLVVSAQVLVSLPLACFLQRAFACVQHLGLRLSLIFGLAYMVWLVPTLVAAFATQMLFLPVLLFPSVIPGVSVLFLPRAHHSTRRLSTILSSNESSPVKPFSSFQRQSSPFFCSAASGTGSFIECTRAIFPYQGRSFSISGSFCRPVVCGLIGMVQILG